jgi:ribosome recycling factor
MIDETLEELEDAIAKAHEALRRDLARIRTGRASPDMLDSIRVEYYGAQTPLNQMASVTAPEPRMLVVKPWDKSSIQAIERAIQMSPVELNPQNDGEVIRLPIPMLTEERRREFVKLAKDHGEKCKVAIRAARRDSKSMIESLVKEGEVGEDQGDAGLKKMESIVQAATSKTDEIVARREKDILTV